MYTENMAQVIEKVKEFSAIYAPFLIEEKIPLKVFIGENTSSRTVPQSSEGMREISVGETWGKQFSYSWFYSEFEAGVSLEGKNLWLISENGAVENLVFVNGRAVGMFDNIPAERCFPYVHRYQRYVLLTEHAKVGEKYRIALEGYASHVVPGCYPLESAQTLGMNGVYEKNIFQGLYVAVKNSAVACFLNLMQIFTELYDHTDDRFLKGELQKCGEKLYSLLSRCPNREEIDKPLEEANKVLEECLFRKGEKKDNCFIGLIGHSHLDTAWLWNTTETRHKFARTMSNAVTLLKEFEEYRFFSSSVLHYRWLKEDYPALFEEVKELVKRGKIEPNGASYVECDANMTGAESFVRQFVRGTRLLKEYFDYTPDTFWLPDTFGYTGSLPQILCGAGIRNFLTTKLSWNETNQFSYDTFRWVGTDQRSSVLVHLNTMGDWGSPKYILHEKNNIRMPRAANRGLHAYGFGDGGGGPHREMVEIAIRMKDTVGLPETGHVLVSDFMKGFRMQDLPVVFGELYLELHRGTYTSMHEIKRSNRKLEIALSNAELSYAADKRKWDQKSETDKLYDVLLVNQFHDILPGSSIRDVNETAVRENYAAIGGAQKVVRANLPVGKKVFNPHSFAVNTPFVAASEEDFEWTYSNFLGEKNVCVSQYLAPYSTAETAPPKGTEGIVFSGKVLKTPLMQVTFNENMEIVSLIDLENGRECSEGALNRIVMYESMPLKFDNWDIDADLPKKELCCAALEKSEAFGERGVFRIVNRYRLGKNTLLQEMRFFAGSKQIEFDTLLDMKEQHRVVKAVFETNIVASTFKNEMQFGYEERPLLRNNSVDAAKFEVCNHKYTDISENGYGFSVFNDCKYGISGDGSVLALTLFKNGMHPDESGDLGQKRFKYAICPHMGGFSDEVVRRAYIFNNPPFMVGKNDFIKPFLRISADNIICETVKVAEDKSGYVLRLYECAKTRTKAKIFFDGDVKAVYCDLLEREKEVCYSKDGELSTEFAPFEIKTIKICVEG